MIKENLITSAKKGLPTHEELKTLGRTYKNKGGTLVLLDDCYQALEGDDLATLFAETVHHLNMSIVLILQTLFNTRSKSMRIISINTQYLILFKMNRDLSQIMSLGMQVRPYDPSYIVKAYLSATRSNYNYLLMDFSSRQNPALRLRSRIFLDEQPMIVFLENSFKS